MGSGVVLTLGEWECLPTNANAGAIAVFVATTFVMRFRKQLLVKYSREKENHGALQTGKLWECRRMEWLSDTYQESCHMFAHIS